MNIQRTLKNAALIATIVAFVGIAAVAAGQEEATDFDPNRSDTVGGGQRQESAQKDTRAAWGMPPASNAFKCQFKVGAIQGQQVTGLQVTSITPAHDQVDGTYSAIFPDGYAAPKHYFVLTDPVTIWGGTIWKYWGDNRRIRCTLVVRSGGRYVSFRSCSTGLDWMNCDAIY